MNSITNLSFLAKQANIAAILGTIAAALILFVLFVYRDRINGVVSKRTDFASGLPILFLIFCLAGGYFAFILGYVGYEVTSSIFAEMESSAKIAVGTSLASLLILEGTKSYLFLRTAEYKKNKVLEWLRIAAIIVSVLSILAFISNTAAATSKLKKRIEADCDRHIEAIYNKPIYQCENWERELKRLERELSAEKSQLEIRKIRDIRRLKSSLGIIGNISSLADPLVKEEAIYYIEKIQAIYAEQNRELESEYAHRITGARKYLNQCQDNLEY